MWTTLCSARGAPSPLDPTRATPSVQRQGVVGAAAAHVCARITVRTAVPAECPCLPTPPPLRRKCYYPGALALYAELDRAFARRTQGALARLRAAQRPYPAGLPPVPAEGSSPEGSSPRATPPLPPAAAALPGSSPRAGIEQDAAEAVAEVAAERREAEQPPQSLLAAEPTFSLKQNGLLEEPPAAGTAAAAAAEAAGTAGAAPGLLGAGSQPLLRHAGSGGGSGSFGRPPRSPRPVPRPRPLALSPQSFRGLPAGEPLLSPTGTSPRSTSGPGEESLAGSTWGASSLATAQRGPFAFSHAGSVELADTLTSRLRPLVTSANGPAAAGRGGSATQRGGGVEAAAPAASVQPHQEGSNLVFLSARPESYKVGRLPAMLAATAPGQCACYGSMAVDGCPHPAVCCALP